MKIKGAYIHIKGRDGALLKNDQLLLFHTKEVVFPDNGEFFNSQNIMLFVKLRIPWKKNKPKELLGRPFCVLTGHHIHWDQTIFTGEPVGELLKNVKSTFVSFCKIFFLVWKMDMNLYPKYPLYLYLVEGFPTGQPDVVHTWSTFTMQQRRLKLISTFWIRNTKPGSLSACK